jgi:hypothetical protein
MSAKDIQLKPIDATTANNFVRAHHYSGKVVPNSQVHLGVYYFGKLEGVMQFGPSLAKKNSIGLVKDTSWNGFIELNRMVFTDALPKNSESRAISVAMRMLKKYAPTVEWVISFADGTMCGDGTIYRASGFCLTDIKINTQLRIDPLTGEPKHAMTAFHNGRKHEFSKWEKIPGFQLRYIYFINPEAKKRLAVPILPFSKIAEMGATMYKGSRGESIVSDATGFQPVQGGANPTSLLQPKDN